MRCMCVYVCVCVCVHPLLCVHFSVPCFPTNIFNVHFNFQFHPKSWSRFKSSSLSPTYPLPLFVFSLGLQYQHTVVPILLPFLSFPLDVVSSLLLCLSIFFIRPGLCIGPSLSLSAIHLFPVGLLFCCHRFECFSLCVYMYVCMCVCFVALLCVHVLMMFGGFPRSSLMCFISAPTPCHDRLGDSPRKWSTTWMIFFIWMMSCVVNPLLVVSPQRNSRSFCPGQDVVWCPQSQELGLHCETRRIGGNRRYLED